MSNTNQANAAYGTIPGGFQNSVGGQFAFAAGNRAKANHPGSFVWGDSTAADIASTANNQFTVRAGGGVRFLTGGAGMTVDGTDILTGLNATLLDGLDSTAFSRTNHNHLGQSWSGAVFKGLAVTNTAGAALNAVALEGVATGSAVATYGVVGQSSSPFGAGIWAQGSGGNGTALKVSSGAIQVAGAGIGTSTAVFVHQATAANIEAASPHRTTITNPFTDGNPNAILIVTPNYNPGTIGGVLDPHPIGVFYHSTLLKWQIFHQDFSNMVVNAAFNVLAVKP